MKKLVLMAALGTLSLAAYGQSTNQVPNNLPSGDAGNFFQNSWNWVSSSNPGIPVHGSLEVSAGAVTQSGLAIGSDFDIRYKMYSFSPSLGVLGESVTRNAAIAGTIVAENIGVGLYYIPVSTPDIEFSVGVLGGENLEDRAAQITGYIDIRKMTTANTFVEARLAVRSEFNTAPIDPELTAAVGFML